MIDIKKEGLTLFFRLTASGLLGRTCLTACTARCVIDAQGHLAAVITIRHVCIAHHLSPCVRYPSLISYIYNIAHHWPIVNIIH